MSTCNHDCSSCSSKCESASLLEKPSKYSKIKNVIAVVSGKGGVGKSLTTALMATVSQRKGYQTAILDADLTGPSIPKIFGLTQKAEGDETGILPISTNSGIKVMSVNLLLEDTSSPVVWRGPVIAGVVKQFWTDVNWGNVDFMFVDCPPGTGDVPLTVFQSLPIKGIIVVTSPQDLVSMIVEKAVNMAKMMNIPVLGLVENMSYFVCDNCNTRHYLYGKGALEQNAKKYNVNNVLSLPIMPEVATGCDDGAVEKLVLPEVEEFFDKIAKQWTK